ncbi:MAG TPA: hypothetical protein VMS93_01040, partial [Candidatus Saccharimonadales bacterium]|nr:hypothetical protein [Candidatus Saccharimonadales bacterium]
AYFKSILRDGSVLPLREFYREATSAFIDLRKGFMHAPMAVTAAVAGVPPTELWRVWPALAGPCVAACFYVLARALSPSRAAAALGTLGFALLYTGPGSNFLLTVGCPKQTADALAWLAWAGAVARLRPGAPASPFPVAWVLAAASMVHVFAAVPWFFSWGLFALILLLVPSMRRHAPAAWRLLVVSALCCAPILAWRFLVSYHPVNILHTRVDGLLILPLGYVQAPLALVQRLGATAWLSLVISPFFLAHDRRPERLLMCLTLWGAAGLLLNPAAMPILAPKMNYMVGRLYVPALALCLTAMWAVDQARGLASGPLRLRAAAAVWLAAVALLVGPDLRAGVKGYGPEALAAAAAQTPAPWGAALGFLDRSYPRAQVVASDPVTEYSVAALTRHDVLATLNQHSSPSDPEALDRIRAAQDIMSPGCGPARTAALLRRYGVDLVVVNHTFRYRLIYYLAALDPVDYPAIEDKFRAHPEVFREVFHGPGQWVYQVRPEALSAYASLPGPAWPELQPPAGRPAVDVGEGTWLADARLEPHRVARGDSAVLECLVRRAAPPAPGDPLMARVDLATDYRGAPRWLPQRLRRLALQRREGRRYRLHSYAMLGGSGGAPEYWPPGRWVAWRSVLYVPRRAAPGPYRLLVRVERQEMVPSMSLREYLSDDYPPWGPALDTLWVQP